MAEKPGDKFDDDESITPETRVLRRIPPGRFVEDRDGPRPQSDNFSNHDDGTGTSVDIMVEGFDPLAQLDGLDGYGLVSISVLNIRNAGLGIVPDPLPDNPHHANLQGKKTRGVKRQLALSAEWIVMPEPD